MARVFERQKKLNLCATTHPHCRFAYLNHLDGRTLVRKLHTSFACRVQLVERVLVRRAQRGQLGLGRVQLGGGRWRGRGTEMGTEMGRDRWAGDGDEGRRWDEIDRQGVVR